MISLVSRCAIRKDNQLIFVSADYNLLYSFDLVNEKIELLCQIEGEPFIKKELFSCILSWNDKYILIPYNANHVFCVSKDFLYSEAIGPVFCGNAKFASACIVKDYVYLINHNYSSIIKMNLLTGEIKEIRTQEGFYFYSAYRYKNNIYLPNCSCGSICILNVLNDELMVKHFDISCGFNSIIREGTYLYLGPRNGSSIIKIDEYGNYLDEIIIDEWNSYGMFILEEKIFLPSNTKTGIYIIDGENHRIEMKKFPYSSSVSIDDNVQVLVDNDANLELYNKNEKKNVKMIVNDKILQEFANDNWRKKNTNDDHCLFINESSRKALQIFINMITSDEN